MLQKWITFKFMLKFRMENKIFQLIWCSENLVSFPFLCSGCRADANEAAVVLLPSNITVFTLDFSGSGLSDGDYVSLGWHEVPFLVIFYCFTMWSMTEVKYPVLISEKWPQSCDIIFKEQWESISDWPLGKIDGCSDKVGDWSFLYLKYWVDNLYIVKGSKLNCSGLDFCSFCSGIQYLPHWFEDAMLLIRY